MVVDGKKIAEDIKCELKRDVELLSHTPVLALVVAGEDPVIEKFIGIKKRFAKSIGVHIKEHRFSETIGTDVLLGKVEELALDESISGIIVQLPLPKHIEIDTILGAIPASKDVDVISKEGVALFESGGSYILPPVVGAFAEIIKREKIEVKDKNVVVIGRGSLVGRPAALWFKTKGANVKILDKTVVDITLEVQKADILISGAGCPGLVKPKMLKDGVVLLDAGTSEASGRLAGDADPFCAEKCSVFTPVPGGIGPITVAVLFRNLFILFSDI